MASSNSTVSTFVSVELTLETDEQKFDPIELEQHYNSLYNRFFKRVIDLVLAIVLFIALSPIFLIISAFIAVDTGFPVLYRAERGGFKGKNFKINKFRTMVKNADKIGGGTTALNDPRITKIGAFLRKTKLDEIAQLFNIIDGSMSFIGPRPELTRYTEQYDDIQKNILNVRPGITDFSSIALISLDEIVGSDNADEIYEKYVLQKKNQLRLKYVNEVSFKTDIKLFFLTVFRVIKKALSVISKIIKRDKNGIHNT